MLRKAYFASLDGKLDHMASAATPTNNRTDSHHVKHCFEYLRQSLMCLADTNFERLDLATGGVSGWHSERTCADFQGVVAWANEWGVSGSDR